MNQANPYEKYLDGWNPMQVLPSTAQRIGELIDQVGSERANVAPAAGKWGAREIVCHLADCELAFGFRLRQALADDHHVIQPFDQERWAVNYSGYELDDALMTFGAMRRWNLALLRSLSPEVHAKPVTHPERGTMTFYTIVETMAGHDLNHLAQLESIGQGRDRAH
jgi:hypothetical protein